MSVILRPRVVFRGDDTQRAWVVAIVLSLLLHAALLAWPRWPSLREFGGDPGLAARLVASPASDTAARSPVGDLPKLPDSTNSAARSEVPASVSAKAPRAEAPAAPARAQEQVRAAPVVVPEPPPAPSAIEAASRREAALSGAIAANAKAPGSASDIASVAQYRIALMSAARRFLRAPDVAGAQGLEGRVEVRLAIAADGSLARAEVARSSGHTALDELALEMLRSAKSEAPVPPALLAREFEVEVPVVFAAPSGSAR